MPLRSQLLATLPRHDSGGRFLNESLPPLRTLAPTEASERITLLDALRGFALLGIVLYNVEALSGFAFLTPDMRQALPLSRFDPALEFFRYAFLEAKFYSLFSLLFGVGFAVFRNRAERRDADFPALFRRRLWVLFAIGLAHSVLVWFGDILHVYALGGFVLLALRDRSERVLLRTAIALLVAPLALYLVFYLVRMPDPFAAAASSGSGDVLGGIRRALAQGSYPEVVQTNLLLTAFGWFRRLFNHALLRFVGMFVLGYWAGRAALFENVAANRARLRGWLAAGIFIGLPANLVYGWFGDVGFALPVTWLGALKVGVGTIGIPLLCLGYVAALALAYETPLGRRILARFAPVGRMALTNYLLQSVLCVTIFCGFGFGRFGRVSYAVALLIALGVYLLQLIASPLWLARWKQGPMEALWRRFTYGRV